MDYASKEYRLETLYQIQSMIQFYLGHAKSIASVKEWSDKLAANQKEIDLIINPK